MAYALIEPDAMVSAGGRLLGLWGMVTALQWLATTEQWRTGSALGWDLQGLRVSRLYGSLWLARIFAALGVRGVALSQLAASLSLCLTPSGWPALGALLVLAAATALLILRSSADGADKMAMVVMYGLLLQQLGAVLEQPMLALAGLWWAGGQLVLAYATSGIAKLTLADWRNGAAPRKALSTYLHGHRMAHRLLRQRSVALTVAWAVILIETLLPLALFAPLPVLAVMLAGMLLLHLMIAAAMGLNTYPLAFAAAYPSVLMLAQWLDRL